jgi:ankyrin repeat protein
MPHLITPTPQDLLARITGFLLPHARDLRALSVDGMPLVSWAVMINSQSVAQLLLKAGADVNAVDAEGRTPLMLAAMTRNGAMSKALLEAGADQELKNREGLTAAELGTRAQAPPGPVSSGDSDGSPAPAVSVHQDDIFTAIVDNRIEDVKRLVADNPKALFQMRGGVQPLHLAIALGRQPTVQWLLEHGSSSTAKASDQSSCLGVALAAGRIELARWLMDQADIVGRMSMMQDLHQLWSANGNSLALRLALAAGWKPLTMAMR